MTGVAQFHMTFANNTAVRQLLGDHPTASRQLDHPRWTWESGPWGGGLNEPWNDIVDRASVPAKSTLLAGAEAQKSRIISWQSPPTWCVIQAQESIVASISKSVAFAAGAGKFKWE